jgi:hypothetical protein
MITEEQLADKKLHELRSITTDLGASWHPKEKRVDLIPRIIELSAIVQPSDKPSNAITSQKEKPKPVVVTLTKEQIVEAVRPYVERGLLIRFHPIGADAATSWEMKFKDKMDSGGMRQPVGVVVRCADMLMRGSSTLKPKCKHCGQYSLVNSEVDISGGSGVMTTNGYACSNQECTRYGKSGEPPKPRNKGDVV